MAIKVLIKRNFKADSLHQASQLLMRTRYEAMRMKGYISSETWSNFDDHTKVAVISMWHTVEDWQSWRGSPKRGEFAAKLQNIMTAPEQKELFVLGIQDEV